MAVLLHWPLEGGESLSNVGRQTHLYYTDFRDFEYPLTAVCSEHEKKWNRFLSGLQLLSAFANITIMATLEFLLISGTLCGRLEGGCIARVMKRGREPEVKTQK
jgi:hypothetical protein